MQDGWRRTMGAESAQGRVTDGVVTAKEERLVATLDDRLDRRLDSRSGAFAVAWKRDVAGILDQRRRPDIVAALVPGVTRQGMQGSANAGWCIGRPALERR